MALVEKFHVVAAERPVATGQTIKEGQFVSLNASAQVVVVSASYPVPYGIAGDTKNTTASSMPGIVAGWQNRVSDYFDETKASGKMTVYHSGGEFATDMFTANVSSSSLLDVLYANGDGILDTVDANGNTWKGVGGGTGLIPPVARLTQKPAYYPSGVPGIDINGDQALAGDSYTNMGTSNYYIELKLII